MPMLDRDIMKLLRDEINRGLGAKQLLNSVYMYGRVDPDTGDILIPKKTYEDIEKFYADREN